MARIIYGIPTNITFEDMFKPTEEESYASSQAKFIALYKASAFYDAVGNNLNNSISDTNLPILFNLLWANYAKSSFKSTYIEKAKIELFSLIFKYGPTWQKQLDIQNKIRNLSDAELQAGSKAIHNHAYNPGTAPSVDELTAINEQNTSNFNKSKIDAYTLQWDMLSKDVTTDFINKFKVLFMGVVAPIEQPVWEVE